MTVRVREVAPFGERKEIRSCWLHLIRPFVSTLKQSFQCTLRMGGSVRLVLSSQGQQGKEKPRYGHQHQPHHLPSQLMWLRAALFFPSEASVERPRVAV